MQGYGEEADNPLMPVASSVPSRMEPWPVNVGEVSKPSGEPIVGRYDRPYCGTFYRAHRSVQYVLPCKQPYPAAWFDELWSDHKSSKASIARDLKISIMTVYPALGSTAPMTAPPQKSPVVTIFLHLIVENFHKTSKAGSLRERIEAMLERDYAMIKTCRCEYTLTVAYDRDPEGVSLDYAINDFYAEMSDTAESNNCSIAADVQKILGEERSW